ncbi:MAG: hypothetical protein AAB412_05995 [Elusimicrobiota bacterium]
MSRRFPGTLALLSSILFLPAQAWATGLPAPLLLAGLEMSLGQAVWLLLVCSAAVTGRLDQDKWGGWSKKLLAPATIALASLLIPVAILLPAWPVGAQAYHRLRLEPVLLILLFAYPLLPIAYWRLRVRGDGDRIGTLGRWRWSAFSLAALGCSLAFVLFSPVLRPIFLAVGPRVGTAFFALVGICAALGPMVAFCAVAALELGRRNHP